MVNESAVQNSVAVIKPSGMNNILGDDMHRAVTSDIASLVDKVSDLIARAHRGEDVVRELQDAVDCSYGIGYAKKFFIGVMICNDQHECFIIVDTHAVAAAPAVGLCAGGVA